MRWLGPRQGRKAVHKVAVIMELLGKEIYRIFPIRIEQSVA
jgi:hypothetical protein